MNKIFLKKFNNIQKSKLFEFYAQHIKINRKDLIISNDLLDKGDICGKQHLLELFKTGFPVIPSFTSKEEIIKLGCPDPKKRWDLQPYTASM